MAEAAQAKAAHVIPLKASAISAFRFTAAEAGFGFTSVWPAENAYLVAIQLEDAPSSELWKGRKLASTVPFMAGSLIISHLREEPRFNFREPFDFLALHIPEIAFHELAAERGAPKISGLRSEMRAYDSTLHHLARAVLPALGNPLLAANSFLTQLSVAMCFRLAQRYGLQAESVAPQAGSLSIAQLSLAKKLLTSDLTISPPLDQIARACGMSAGRFAKSFRETTGLPPHRWLRGFRVEQAKEFLLSTSMSLAQIAYECGFADQAHFTRVFSAATQITPAIWRRVRRG
jgi:AraC family transcriptional regulator